VTQVSVDLASTLGGSAGDGVVDTVVTEATSGNDQINVVQSGGALIVKGLSAEVQIEHGEAANDQLSINGHAGNDRFDASAVTAGAMRLVLDGGADVDTASYHNQTAAIAVTLNGAIDATVTFGGAVEGTIRNIENVTGGSGNDTLTGDSLANVLSGGRGKDTLTGGANADSFDFNLKTETPKGANHDVIMDFSGVGGELDHIDVRGIDANTQLHGNQNFHFIGAHHFHHEAGELHVLDKGAFFLVEGDIDGNGHADFQIEVHSAAALAKADFIL
jgi:Ca2+-binding RTX toxin-like protein